MLVDLPRPAVLNSTRGITTAGASPTIAYNLRAMLAGTSLGHYRIISPLGKGGMGEVYTAEDTRLKRQVALKLLPADLAADPERLARFRREAEALAALNHPNIVTIYSIEDADGHQFLTMELVAGEPLAARLVPDGLPVTTAVDWATQICDAMTSAHERGIVHRDLKPANVMITSENRVKVLDFGLSKRVQQVSASAATQLAQDSLTEQGSFLGTVAYMSPEQAQGRPVDDRSDIFSFGVIVYEMLAGRRPFTGDSQLSILSAILRDTPPPIRQRRAEVPARLGDSLVNRCLAKMPADRYQSFREVRDELAAVSPRHNATGTSQAATRRYRRVAVAALLLLLTAAAGVGLFTWMTREDPQALPSLEGMALLTTHGSAGLAAVSPDGKYVAYVRDPLGRPSLWIRQATAANDLQIVPPLDVRYKGLTFSPDGSYVYYTIYDRAGEWGSLHRVRALGGHSEKILHDIDTGISFNRVGTRFAFIRFVISKDSQTSQVMTAQPDGSDQRVVAGFRVDLQQLETCAPTWSPDDSRLLAVFFAARGVQLGAIDAVTGERQLIPQQWLSINSTSWSGRSIVLSGRPLASSGKGWSGRGPTRLWTVDPETGDQLPLTRDVSTYEGLSAAADGKSVVTVRTEPEAQIWVADQAGSRQVTSGDFVDGITGVSWLKEERIVFASNRAEPGEAWTVQSDGTGLEKLGLGTNIWWPSPIPDGTSLFFHRTGSLWRSSPNGSDSVQVATPVSQTDPLVTARHGDSVYYLGGEKGADGAMVFAIYRAHAGGGTPTIVRRGHLELYDVLTDGRLLGATTVPQVKGGPGEVRAAAVLVDLAANVQVLEGIPLIKPALRGEKLSIPFLSASKENAILYVDVRGDAANVWEHALIDGRKRQLTNFEAGTIFGFARSSGGRLAISHGRVKHDVVRIALSNDK